MSDRELGVTFSGDISDISAKLDTLVSELGQLQDMTIDLTINADTTAVEQLESDLSGLAPTADNAANELNQVSSTSNDAAQNMNILGDSSTNATGVMVNLSGVIGQFSGEAGNAVGQVQNLATNLLGAENAAALLAPEVLALVAAVAAFTAATALAVGAAGDFQDSWLRLGQAVGEGNTSITQLQGNWNDAINNMKDNTGRSAGIIRDHIINMGVAGVTSKDLIINSFSGISGAAFVTGQSIDSIESAFRRVISTGMLGTRQLMTFGLTTDDVFKATGMTMEEVRGKFQSLDVEGRTALMNLILNTKYGAEANEAYKNSWQGVTDKLQAAFTALSIAFGSLFLPIVIPALKTATTILSTIAATINSLPAPVKVVTGAFVLLAGTLTTLTLLWAPLTALWTFLNTNLSLAAIRTTALTIAMGAYSAAQSIANGLLTFFNALLNLNPLALVAVAVMAVVTALIALNAQFGIFKSNIERANDTIGKLDTNSKNAAKSVEFWKNEVAKAVPGTQAYQDAQIELAKAQERNGKATTELNNAQLKLNDYTNKLADVESRLAAAKERLIELTIQQKVATRQMTEEEARNQIARLQELDLSNQEITNKEKEIQKINGLSDSIEQNNQKIRDGNKDGKEWGQTWWDIFDAIDLVQPKYDQLGNTVERNKTPLDEFNWLLGDMSTIITVGHSPSVLDALGDLMNIVDKFGKLLGDVWRPIDTFIKQLKQIVGITYGESPGVIPGLETVNDLLDNATTNMDNLGSSGATNLNDIVNGLYTGGIGGLTLGSKSDNITNSGNVTVNVDMNGANINSGTMTAEEAGSTIGGSVAKQVSSALNGGVSVINYKRGSGGRLN